MYYTIVAGILFYIIYYCIIYYTIFAGISENLSATIRTIREILSYQKRWDLRYLIIIIIYFFLLLLFVIIYDYIIWYNIYYYYYLSFCFLNNMLCYKAAVRWVISGVVLSFKYLIERRAHNYSFKKCYDFNVPLKFM